MREVVWPRQNGAARRVGEKVNFQASVDARSQDGRQGLAAAAAGYCDPWWEGAAFLLLLKAFMLYCFSFDGVAVKDGRAAGAPEKDA